MTINLYYCRKISGALSFFSLKDSYGSTQITVNRDTSESSKLLDELVTVPVDSVVVVEGLVQVRPEAAQKKGVLKFIAY